MSRADVKLPGLFVVGLVLVAGCREEKDLPVTYEPVAVPPSIGEVTPSPLSVGPSELVRLRVTATDARGAPLSFAWSTNAGAVSTPVNGADRSEAVWTSLSCLPADVTPTVTVTVTSAAGLSTPHTFPLTWTGPVCTRPPCAFSLGDKRVALEADCTTDSTLFVPDDYTFDGQGHTVTAVDPLGPAGSHFIGAVIQNRGGTARVRGVSVTASGLTDFCESGAARLGGIRLDGASGEVVDSEVRDLNKGLTTSGCQEGVGIEVRNDDASRGPFRVDVLRNRVSGYQKVGIWAVGAVEVNVADNTVDGRGRVGHIARNGIQVSNGATGQVRGNTVSSNAYDGPAVDTTGAGILVSGGSYYGPGKPLVTGLVVEGNTLTDNDIGISLSQYEGTNADPPATKTLIRVAGNDLRSGAVSNPSYQAGIADSGTGNVITANSISGAGYTPDVARHIYAVDVYTLKPASKLVFLTSAHDLSPGVCSGRVTVQSQDADGNLVPSTGTFSLGASGAAAPGVTFYEDAGCARSVTTLDLSAPQAEASFFFKSSQAGGVTVSVSGGSLSTATQDETIR